MRARQISVRLLILNDPPARLRTVHAAKEWADKVAHLLCERFLSATQRRTLHSALSRWEETYREQAGGALRTSTRPTLNRLLLLRRVRVYVRAFTLKASHALISVECLFSMTLLPGSAASQDSKVRRSVHQAFRSNGVPSLGVPRRGHDAAQNRIEPGEAVQVDPRLTPG